MVVQTYPKPKEPESLVKKDNLADSSFFTINLESYCSRSMSANYDLKVKSVQAAIYSVCFLLCIQVHTCMCMPIWRLAINLDVIPQETAFTCFLFLRQGFSLAWHLFAELDLLASEPSFYSLSSTKVMNTCQLLQLFYPGLSNSGPQARAPASTLLPELFLQPIQLSAFRNMAVLKHSHIHSFT